MKILLDESFPLALVRKLREQEREVEHITLLGLGGSPYTAIIDRLSPEESLFLTHDQEFLDLQEGEALFEVFDDGRLHPWKNASSND